MKNTSSSPVHFIFLFLILLSYQHIFAQEKTKTLTLQHSKNIKITALDKLNSPQRETNLTISPDGNHLFFMSDRGGQTWSRPSGTYKGRPRFDGDIWVSQKIDGQWQIPNPLAHTINTLNGEDEPSISQDGQRVYFQSWKSDWANKGGPYYSAELDGNHWTKSQGLGGGINQFFGDEFRKKMRYATDGMSISPNEKTFIVVAGTNYDAPMDIYISRKNQNGAWDYCQKLSVSTPKDERSVFLAADGHTLYFASEGYGGFGGLDIFKTTIKADGTHGEVINLGEPFNTNKDDYGFILNASGEEAYFVRNGDIYFANLQEADIRIRPDSMAIIYGQITDKQTKKTLKAQIEIFLGETEQAQNKINQAHSNSVSGMYNMVLPKLGQNYYQKVFLKGYKTAYRTFEVRSKERFYKIRQDFELEKESSEPKEFKVLFDFDQSIIKQDYLKDLNALVDFLIQNPATKIKIIGHTDDKGANQYNLNLSQKRMQSILDFLLSKGIEKSRIQSSFEGEQKPIADNQQPEGRMENRRVTIVILK